MRTPECQGIVDHAIRHLNGEFRTRAFDDECLVVTPFLTADLAPVEIFVKSIGNGLRLSDAGESINQLFTNGMNLDPSSRLNADVMEIAKTCSVIYDDSELSLEIDESELGPSLQRFATAIQAVSYLIYKRSYRTRIPFREEVEKLLAIREIPYDTSYSLRGLSTTHRISFHLNRGMEVLLEPFTAQSFQSAKRRAIQIGFKWFDIRQEFAKRFKMVVVADDRTESSSAIVRDSEAMAPILSYSDEVLIWSDDQGKLANLGIPEIA